MGYFIKPLPSSPSLNEMELLIGSEISFSKANLDQMKNVAKQTIVPMTLVNFNRVFNIFIIFRELCRQFHEQLQYTPDYLFEYDDG